MAQQTKSKDREVVSEPKRVETIVTDQIENEAKDLNGETWPFAKHLSLSINVHRPSQVKIQQWYPDNPEGTYFSVKFANSNDDSSVTIFFSKEGIKRLAEALMP